MSDSHSGPQPGEVREKYARARLLLVGSEAPKSAALLDAAGVEWQFATAETAAQTVLEARLARHPFSGLVVELPPADPASSSLKQEPLLATLPILFLEPQGWSVYRAAPADAGFVATFPKLLEGGALSRSARELAVLVVDDMPVNRKFLMAYLQQLGHHGTEAASAEEALHLLETSDFDLVLMDVEMPDGDGVQATWSLRQGQGPNRFVPVLAVTGHTGEGERQRLLEQGLNDVLAKPVAREQLAEKLKAWGGKRIVPCPNRKPRPAEAFDPSNLLEVTQGNAQMLAELIDVFLQDVDTCLRRLEQNLTDGDQAGFLSCARTIAGAAETVGAGRLALAARSAEELVWPDQAQEGLSRLRQESERVRDAVRGGYREPDLVDVEINTPLELDESQLATIDLHSFLNIFNVIASELYFLSEDLRLGDVLYPCRRLIETFAADLQKPTGLRAALRSAPAVFAEFWRLLSAATGRLPNQARVEKTTDNLRSILAVTEVRIAELESRLAHPDRWVAHDISTLVASYQQVLAAIAKNSKGRYQIVFNVAAKTDNDYLIHLDIQSVDGSTITMPAVLQDVFRDLIANARKYTEPGGTIQAGLADDGQVLRLAVEDTGRGIPAREVPRVVEMGYRASNVGDRPTMGGGFGLTKAYWVTSRFGGTMRIRSGRNRGTRVVLTIPRPASPVAAAAASQAAAGQG